MVRPHKDNYPWLKQTFNFCGVHSTAIIIIIAERLSTRQLIVLYARLAFVYIHVYIRTRDTYTQCRPRARAFSRCGLVCMESSSV